MFTAMKYFAVCLIFIWVMPDSTTSFGYQITKIKNNPGVYFDYLNQLNFIAEKQTLMININITQLLELRNGIEYLFRNVLDACLKTNCSFYQELKQMPSRLNSTDQSLMDTFVGLVEIEPKTESQRNKRSIDDFKHLPNDTLLNLNISTGVITFDITDNVPIDIPLNIYLPSASLSLVSNVLFGTMDIVEQTMIYYTLKRINHVRSTIQDNINKSYTIYQQNFDSLSKDFENMRVILNNLNKATSQLEINQEIVNRKMELGNLISDYKLSVMNLINGIKFAQLGQVHPKLIAPKTIFEKIKSIVADSAYKLPFDLELQNLHDIYSISDMKMILSNGGFVFILTFPLINDVNFDLYKVLPLSTTIWFKNENVSLRPKSSHLIIKADEEYYSHTSAENLKKCKYIPGRKYLCPQMNALRKTDAAESCDVKILTGQKISDPRKQCSLNVMKYPETHWEKLNNENEWVFSAPSPSKLSIKCINLKTVKEGTYEISGTGILKLNGSCIAKSGRITLLPKITHKEEPVTKIITPTVDIDVNKIFNDFDKFNISFDEAIKDIRASENIIDHSIDVEIQDMYKLEDIVSNAQKLAEQNSYKLLPSPSPGGWLLRNFINLFSLVIAYYMFKFVYKISKSNTYTR